jgi:peptidoglycan/xylan/chitin deacetylase (PgdA/CDA1 family)
MEPVSDGSRGRRRAAAHVHAWLVAVVCAAAVVLTAPADVVDGGIIRGPRGEKRIALEFTGHEFGEGGDTILDALRAHGAQASFFFTGDFCRNPAFAGLIRRIRDEGHYLGPHSDRHLLYCDWTPEKPLLVSRAVFDADLEDNLRALEAHGVDRRRVRYWIPPYEQYNAAIAAWSRDHGITLVNYTPGTRSNADYAGEAEKAFVPSARIVRNILDRDRTDPDGLNGFLLLMHVGAGPGRADKMHDHLAGLLDQLAARGYTFVRIDTLLDGAGVAVSAGERP